MGLEVNRKIIPFKKQPQIKLAKKLLALCEKIMKIIGERDHAVFACCVRTLVRYNKSTVELKRKIA